MMLSGLGLWHFLCWDCRPLRWCNIDPAQLVPTENHVGTVREGTMMWTWEPELLHLALLWAAPPVAEVCTEVEAKGTHHQLVFFQVQGFLLALLCGLSTNPGTCHTTPARGPEDGRPAKTRNSKGVAHKMSHPGFGGVMRQPGTFPREQLSNCWALCVCRAAGREPVPCPQGAGWSVFNVTFSLVLSGVGVGGLIPVQMAANS